MAEGADAARLQAPETPALRAILDHEQPAEPAAWTESKSR
jgi:hypothetical protein